MRDCSAVASAYATMRDGRQVRGTQASIERVVIRVARDVVIVIRSWT
jgi:hypothetical protein